MTAAISAREPLSSADKGAPGRGRRREAEEWQLVSEASHELRRPLTALRTEVELALLGNRDAGELRAALRSAADEIRRVCRLADDILVLARADAGRLPMQPRPLEPRVLLEAAAARARAIARTRGRHIVVRDMAPGRWLLGDPDRAAQALDNLVSNALQYGNGTITLAVRDDGELLGLHVTDQGTGFAEDIRATAFQRFTRGRRAREPGSGLGLSLVAAIASAHRGAATVCNLPEGGADVCIALPRALRLLCGSVQPIPGTADSLNGLDPEWAVDLFPQVADIDVDNVGSVLVSHVPSTLQQVIAGQDLSWPTHEDLEQLELLRRQRDLRSPPADDTGAGIQH
jgi:signal transduction histidine kinase